MRTKHITKLLVAATATCSVVVEGGFWSGGSETEAVDEGKKTTPDEPVHYGVDVSFPMHHARVSENYPWLEHNKNHNVKAPKELEDTVIQPLGDRATFYKKFLDSCQTHFGSKGTRCVSNELDRIAMSLRQPQSMQNYTQIGFKKIKTPESIWSLVKDFWDKNKDNQSEENWGVGNTYTNNWDVPTSMVSVENSGLRGGGGGLKQKIWDAARIVIQEWTGEELTPCSMYGIRIYHEGSILATHVDRLPLVSSAIINVAQDVDEPWPLEVYSHDGRAVNVTMEPGDMVLYESHSILHGRPFPLKGRFMANLFVHFEPTGHSLRHNAKIAAEEGRKLDVHEKYKDALQRGAGGHENDQSGLPAYIIAGTPEETNWRRQHPEGIKSKQNSFSTGSTRAHLAAQLGDIDALKKEVTSKKEAVNAKDVNGWTPLHEGARAGHVEVVKYLVEQGADVNAKTDGSGGGSALWWAKQKLAQDHPMIALLESYGALAIGPDL